MQLASLRSMKPYICGTKPPVSFNPLNPSEEAGARAKDSFIDASLDEIAAFVKSTFGPVPEIMNAEYFIVVDAETVRDGTVILVEIKDAELAAEVAESYNGSEPEDDSESWALMEPIVSRRERAMRRSHVENAPDIEALRLGMAFCVDVMPWMEQNRDDMWGMRHHHTALDGAFWGFEFMGKDPPLMKDRLWVGETRSSHL